MRVLRASSVEEYASWYLKRDRLKHSTCPIADMPDNPVEVMRRDHMGKMRNWFGGFTRWNIVLLDAISDLANLVFLESNWTMTERLVVPDGPNYRLLGRVAENAIAENYLERSSAYKHKAYYNELANGSLRIEGENRVAICSAEGSEIRSNPAARYYLLDGVGRCLPYMMLVTEHLRVFEPIEAFCAGR
jgi:hypothetical protein